MTLKTLMEWQEDGNKIAVFCAGKIGIAIYEIFKKCGVSVDCFFDSDAGKHGRVIVDGCFCRDAELAGDKEEYIVFIGILDRYYEEAWVEAGNRGFTNIADFTEIFDDIIVNYPDLYRELVDWFQDYPLLEVFYVRQPNKNSEAPEHGLLRNRSKRIAVYTSIFGQYDSVYQPLARPDNIDYYFISDGEKPYTSAYTWIDAKRVIPDEITSPVKRNRYVKMHPHLIFPDYEYSIYVDGNIEIRKDISSFMRESDTGISVFMHPRRDCIFYEAITIVNFRRVAAEDVNRQMGRYIKEGMPLHYGMPEMPVIAREHNRPACRKIMEEWWDEFNGGAQRDQLSFMYVLWKNGMGMENIASLGKDYRESEYLEVKKHRTVSMRVKNERI